MFETPNKWNKQINWSFLSFLSVVPLVLSSSHKVLYVAQDGPQHHDLSAEVLESWVTTSGFVFLHILFIYYIYVIFAYTFLKQFWMP